MQKIKKRFTFTFYANEYNLLREIKIFAKREDLVFLKAVKKLIKIGLLADQKGMDIKEYISEGDDDEH